MRDEVSSFDVLASEWQRMQHSSNPPFGRGTSRHGEDRPQSGDGLFRSRSFRRAVYQFEQCLDSGLRQIRFAAPAHSGGKTMMEHVRSWDRYDDGIEIIRLPSIAVDVDVRLTPLQIDEMPALIRWLRRHQWVDGQWDLSPMQQLARHHQTRGCIGLLRESLRGHTTGDQDSNSAMRASS